MLRPSPGSGDENAESVAVQVWKKGCMAGGLQPEAIVDNVLALKTSGFQPALKELYLL